MHQPLDWRKYAIVFLITSTVFFTALYLSSYFNNRKVAEIRAIEDKIAIDILSSETQFALLAEAACKDVDDSTLSTELNTLASKLDYMESSASTNKEELDELKKYYSLLQIKDYMLMNKIKDKCDVQPISIIYFYSNKGDCPDCQKTGYVLSYLRTTYPNLRVYSFDYNLDLSAVQTLIRMNHLQGNLPILIIDGKTYNGYKSHEEIEQLLPELTATATPTTSTSTKKR